MSTTDDDYRPGFEPNDPTFAGAVSDPTDTNSPANPRPGITVEEFKKQLLLQGFSHDEAETIAQSPNSPAVDKTPPPPPNPELVITQEEFHEMVASHFRDHAKASGLRVRTPADHGFRLSLPTRHHATYDTTIDPVTMVATHTPRVHKTSDDVVKAGEAIRHPITAARMERTGVRHVAIEIDLVVGSGSPHTRTHRSRADFERIVKEQIGNLMLESTRKPRTIEEQARWEIQRRKEAAERELAARKAHEAARRAAMTDAERATDDYIKRHGMQPYVEVDPEDFDVAVSMGSMTREHAEVEKERLREWKARHEENVKRDASQVGQVSDGQVDASDPSDPSDTPAA